MRLDRNPSLSLQIHVIQQLVLHFPITHRIGELQQPIRQRTLPMINVGDNTEISNVFHKHLCRKSREKEGEFMSNTIEIQLR
jgi:hypothetical protein